MQSQNKCKNFENPIGYTELCILLFVVTLCWQLVHKFVDKRYHFLNKRRKMVIHDSFIEAGIRIMILLFNAVFLWRRVTPELFFKVAEVHCWEFDILCYLASIVIILSIYQMFFGVWTTKDSFVHHLVLIYSLIEWVQYPNTTLDPIFAGYNMILMSAYAFAAPKSIFAIKYQIAMHHYQTTDQVKYVIKAKDIIKHRSYLLATNLIITWTICCWYYFIQAFNEGMQKDLRFMLSRFLPWWLLISVEVYVVYVHWLIFQKKKKQIATANTKELEIVIDDPILRLSTQHINL